MLRRIELAWPVQDEALKRRVIDECLVAYLYDTKDAWQLGPNGEYTQVINDHQNTPALSAQQALMTRHKLRGI
jgi:polyphosphate kinase